MRYAHTNIVAKDWRVLVKFYEDVFACEYAPPQREQEGAWLSAATGVARAKLSGRHLRLPGHGDNGPTLEIFSYEQSVPGAQTPAANRVGLGHLAFEVEDVRTTLAHLLAAGGSTLGSVVEREIEGVGLITFVYACDPEGNIIELQSWEKDISE